MHKKRVVFFIHDKYVEKLSKYIYKGACNDHIFKFLGQIMKVGNIKGLHV